MAITIELDIVHLITMKFNFGLFHYFENMRTSVDLLVLFLSMRFKTEDGVTH